MSNQTKQAEFNATEALKGAWNYLPRKLEKGVGSLMNSIPEGLSERIGIRPTFRRNDVGIFGDDVGEAGDTLRKLFKNLRKNNDPTALMDYMKGTLGMDKGINSIEKAMYTPQARSWANDLWSNAIWADPKKLYVKPSVSNVAGQVAQGGLLAGGAMAMPNLVHRLKEIGEVKKDRVEEKEAQEKVAEGNPFKKIRSVLFGDTPQNYLQGTANPIFSDWRTLAGLLGVGAGSYALANKGVNAGTNAYSDRFMDKEEQDRRSQLVTEMQNSYKSAGDKEAKKPGDAYAMGGLGALWALLSIPAFGIGRHIGRDTTKVNQFHQLQQAFNKLEASNRPRNVFTVDEEGDNEDALSPTSYKTLSTNSIPFPVPQKKKNFTDNSLKLASATKVSFKELFDPAYWTMFRKDKYKNLGRAQKASPLINKAMASPFFSRFVPESMWNMSGKLPDWKGLPDFSKFKDGKSAWKAWSQAYKSNPIARNSSKNLFNFYDQNQEHLRQGMDSFKKIPGMGSLFG